MQIFEVGGAVRDQLLGLPVQDHDWVVVGATPEQLLAQGYQPVGKDFPVFLHPKTQEEYALARTERKVAAGYSGFTFHTAADVTLEQDLARRDLTINAIARRPDGQLIDPYGGVADLRAGVLRHVSDAFVEDPVRILRLARFAARFGFTVAPETRQLLADMVVNGEVDALVAERVWQEFARGLMEARPSIMIQVLRDCGALARLMPELDRVFGVPQPPQYHPEVDTGIHTLLVLDYAASQGWSLAVRWAALLHDLGKGLTDPAQWPHHAGHERLGEAAVMAIGERLRVPRECRDLARLAAVYHGQIHHAPRLKPAALLRLLQNCDALRRPQRFEELLCACIADARGRPGYEDSAYPAAAYCQQAVAVINAVDAGGVASRCRDKRLIPLALARASLKALRAMARAVAPII